MWQTGADLGPFQVFQVNCLALFFGGLDRCLARELIVNNKDYASLATRT